MMRAVRIHRYFRALLAAAAVAMFLVAGSLAMAEPSDTAPPTGTIVIRSASAGTDLQDAAGKALLETSCGTCHSFTRIENAGYDTYAEWKAEVDSMVSRMSTQDKLSATESATLAGYLDRTYGTGTGDLYGNSLAVKLYLRSSDGSLGSGVTEMAFSNDGTFDDVVTGDEMWVQSGPSSAWNIATGNGLKTVRARFRDVAQNISLIYTDTIFLDTVRPKAFMSAPVLSTDTSKTSSFKVSWSGTDAAPASGVNTYEVQVKKAGGTYTTWKNGVTATTATYPGAAGNTYYFRVRAKDRAGNVSAWSSVKLTVVPYDQSSASFSSTWTAITGSTLSFYKGTDKYTKKAGAYLTYTFKGSAIYVIVQKGTGRGKAKIYIDGVLKATVDTYSSSSAYRKVVYKASFSSATVSHKLKVVNQGTSGRPRLDIDAIGVRR